MVHAGELPVYFRFEHAEPGGRECSMASSAKRRAVAEKQRQQDEEEEDDMEEEMEGEDEEESDDIEDDESEEDEEVHEEVNVDFEAHTMTDGDHDGIKKLLKQVEAHPALWDTSESGYTDRQSQDEAWNTICRNLHPNWDGLPEKEQKIIGKCLICSLGLKAKNIYLFYTVFIESDVKNRWRTVLNRYIQSLAREQRSTSSQAKRKPYIYVKEMTFLTTSGQILQAASNLDADPELVQAEEHQQKRSSSRKGSSAQAGAGSGKGSKRSAKGKKNSVVMPIMPPRPPRLRKRRVVRSRAFISEQVDAGILTLLQRRAAEDGLDDFGRVVATQVRRLPLHRRADFMAFALGSVEFFLPPFKPPAIDTLVSSLRVVCTEQSSSSQSDTS
ncbi:BRCA2 and CDKN1A-interacting protein isoform X1 [Rhinoderma darwinii]|uniref:BRCA2 and CDKN1A-interacting protein isoform X1 n=1 Tax=Rhinoderma darwinii TaxID=43563 RepID=UPI003F676501